VRNKRRRASYFFAVKKYLPALTSHKKIRKNRLVDNKQESPVEQEPQSAIRAKVASICDDGERDIVSLLESIANVLIDGFADMFAIERVEDDGAIKQYVTRHIDSVLEIHLKKLRETNPLLSTSAYGYPRVVKTGKSQFIPGVSPRLAHRLFADMDGHSVSDGLSVRSFICVPLVAYGRTLGALTIMTGRRRFTSDDLLIAEDAAPIIAKCLDDRFLLSKKKTV
jgi:GAF domain-containing protein